MNDKEMKKTADELKGIYKDCLKAAVKEEAKRRAAAEKLGRKEAVDILNKCFKVARGNSEDCELYLKKVGVEAARLLKKSGLMVCGTNAEDNTLHDVTISWGH